MSLIVGWCDALRLHVLMGHIQFNISPTVAWTFYSFNVRQYFMEPQNTLIRFRCIRLLIFYSLFARQHTTYFQPIHLLFRSLFNRSAGLTQCPTHNTHSRWSTQLWKQIIWKLLLWAIFTQLPHLVLRTTKMWKFGNPDNKLFASSLCSL